ncbi:B12-binding domain-containing radical SAM protein [Nitritalea halalkaliphila]|uniref:B12-binding domain-containing radical SAM protein n=1 Tax=Nitritalea halalkaliphila TaxID=590849 RepID=UPI00031B9197|nr:hypothetical protein [Nitritalea halalkaliphila]
MIVLITPPFTQLNTPYPATAYIKGFLNTRQLPSLQLDLGLEVILTLFSRTGLERLFRQLEEKYEDLTEGQKALVDMQDTYIRRIDPVIRFLQYADPTLAYALAAGDYLPQGPRFQQLEELDWAFGQVGIQDKARHFATLFLEDLSDLITQTVDPYFGFSRYAERLSRSASSFEGLLEALQLPPTFTDQLLFERLALREETLRGASLVCLSVPFPGNLYSALRIGQYLKKLYPAVKVAMGGGYPNTELRRLSDPRVFDFLDYVTLDDGERPLLQVYGHACGQVESTQLKRTFIRDQSGEVQFINSEEQPDFPFTAVGTPDYSGLPLSSYLGVIAWTNPMHRMWSDGRWNKLTMAHGCYWKKCSFCDISLPYIQDYSPLSASLLVDRMEELIQATGTTGFHFVDEAAPPALMRELALEILRRGLICTWWTNIRFESRFSYDLCRLLKASGCVAVSGGLEVASDRLLEKMQKGVTVLRWRGWRAILPLQELWCMPTSCMDFLRRQHRKRWIV